MCALVTDMSLMQVAFTSSTPRSSIVPQQLNGRNEIHIEGLEDISSLVSHSFKERGNVITNPPSFKAAVEDFVAPSAEHEEDVSNR